MGATDVVSVLDGIRNVTSTVARGPIYEVVFGKRIERNGSKGNVATEQNNVVLMKNVVSKFYNRDQLV